MSVRVRSWWMRTSLASACGALASLAQPDTGLPVVYLLALPVLSWLWSGTDTLRQAFGLGWFAGLGYFGVTLRWIVEAFLVEPEVFGWMIPFALAGLGGGLALFWAAAFAVARRVAGQRSGVGAALLLAVLWSMAELARGHVLTGFPWALFAYGLVDTPLAQIAAVLGPYGLTFLVMACGLVLGQALRRGREGLALALAVGMLVVAGWVWGGQRLSVAPELVGPLVGVVQPNIPQDQKWRPDLRRANIEKALEPTRLLASAGAAAVIWPESAVPYLLEEDEAARQYVAQSLGDAVLFAGTQRRQDGLWRNSAMTIYPDASIGDIYDKRHLVPFGEYLPLKPVLDRIGFTKLVATPGDFSSGVNEKALVTDRTPPAAITICYEIIFPGEVAQQAERPEWIINITNDAWFGTGAGPMQHLSQAQFRSIEQGLPIFRSANTGVSAIIDPYGRVLSSQAIGTSGFITSALPAAIPITPYARHGEVLNVVLCALTLFGVAATWRWAAT